MPGIWEQRRGSLGNNPYSFHAAPQTPTQEVTKEHVRPLVQGIETLCGKVRQVNAIRPSELNAAAERALMSCAQDIRAIASSKVVTNRQDQIQPAIEASQDSSSAFQMG